jgi:phospholipid/cholesterol/gamma-HCH transport system substrate-binding protein
MAQHKQLTWAELRVGLFVLAGVTLLAVVIFFVTGSGGGLFGGKYRLHTFLPEVDGLTLGAPVRLDGVDVGNVEQIAVSIPKTQEEVTKGRAVRVDLRIQSKFQQYIRADSSAQLITEGLLGNRYVDVDRGFTGRVLQNEEELPGRENTSMQQVVERSADLMQSLDQIAQRAGVIMDKVGSGQGTLGKLIVDDTAYTKLNSSLTDLDDLLSDARAGKGTLGKLVTSDEMYNQANSAVGRLDNILDAVQNKQGSLGKLVYDPAIHDSAKQFLDNGNAVMADVRAGKGTLGKLATDDSLYLEYQKVGENLSSATAKMDSNETMVGKFFSDPMFYDNLTGLSGDMRLLVGDFRRDPKKFLHVKFSIF